MVDKPIKPNQSILIPSIEKFWYNSLVPPMRRNHQKIMRAVIILNLANGTQLIFAKEKKLKELFTI